ncbi:MAG: C40 family peptidase [Gemmatimonadaceae bacterium]
MKTPNVLRPLLASAICSGVLVTTGTAVWARDVGYGRPSVSRSARVFEQYQLVLRDSIVRLTLAQVGTRYSYGGTTPQRGFDCSGLVRYVFAQIYFSTPRRAAEQAHSGAPISREDLRPGDLLTFGVGDSITHIGIYVGERKFVHASSVAGRVIVSSLDRAPSPLIRPLKGARRLLALAGDYELRPGT